MLSFDESRIKSKIQASLGVQHIRVQIETAEAELEKADAALADLPNSLRRNLLEQAENRLDGLYRREKELLAQARRTAEGELKAERLQSLRTEAAPILERASKCLSIACDELRKAANIEREARANGGRIMSEAFDQNAIDYFVPQLTYEQRRGTWRLTR